MTRSARIGRVTTETQVLIELSLDGAGIGRAETGVPFFDHMLLQLGRHAGLDLTVQARGDIEIDAHHTVEDTAIALGQALREALDLLLKDGALDERDVPHLYAALSGPTTSVCAEGAKASSPQRTAAGAAKEVEVARCMHGYRQDADGTVAGNGWVKCPYCPTLAQAAPTPAPEDEERK